MAKLTEIEIAKIQALKLGGMSPRAICDQIGCLPSQVTYHTKALKPVPSGHRGKKVSPAPALDLEAIDKTNITLENIQRLRQLRDDPRASVADQIRASDLLLKWQRGTDDDELQQKLTDAQYEDMLVTMLEELDPVIFGKVAVRLGLSINPAQPAA